MKPTKTLPVRSLLVGGLLAATLLTACGGGGDDGEVASISRTGQDGSATAEPSDADADAEEKMLDYVECLRGQGLDVPDPKFDDEGNARMEMRAERGTRGKGPDDFRKAREVCGDPPAPPGGGRRIDDSEFRDAALAFAKCMREQGIDMPDPQFTTGGGGNGVIFGGGPGGAGRFDPDDPKMKAAQEKCRPIMEELRADDDDE